MKLQYISCYPVEQAVHNYCSEKAWKLGHPQHRYHQIAVSEYLSKKMEPFIAACEPQDRNAARDAFLLKLSQNIRELRPERTASKGELEGRILEKLRTCFPDLSLNKEGIEGEYYSMEWSNAQGELEVDAKWKIIKEGSLPACVEIESIRADSRAKKGRASNFLRAFVSVLQEDGDPYAKVTLKAWTGYTSFYGRANGAYTWSRLGFENREATKQEKINLALAPTWSTIASWKKRLMENFNPSWCYEYYSNSQNKQFASLLDPSFSDRVKGAIEKCKHTWEISALNIDDVPIGRYLMATQDGARYTGVLYPNYPESAGMKQYNTRLSELRTNHGTS